VSYQSRGRDIQPTVKGKKGNEGRPMKKIVEKGKSYYSVRDTKNLDTPALPRIS